jgi:lysophospholipase L1-like esterase
VRHDLARPRPCCRTVALMHTLLHTLRVLATATLALSLLAGCKSAPQSRADTENRRFTAWAASQNLPESQPSLSGRTARMIVRPTLDGTAVRIRLENTVATTPVEFSAVYIGVQDQGARILNDTNRPLTFDGRPSVALAAGASTYSDVIPFPVRAFQPLVVSLAVTRADEIATHSLGLTTNYHARGARAHDTSAEGFEPVPSQARGSESYPFYWITAVDVASDSAAGAIVALGDSITDGRCSTTTPDKTVVPDLHQRWTDVLAARLASARPDRARAIVNAGVAGNRILERSHSGPSALERLDRDVLSLSGVTHVILFDGSNDIHRGATADQLIDGARKIVERIRARNIKIIGATTVPRGRPDAGEGAGFSSIQEQYRHKYNAWIREPGHFDAVIDFDAVMSGGGASPTGAAIMPTEYSCDFTHPNARGHRAMGEAIDLRVFD